MEARTRYRLFVIVLFALSSIDQCAAAELKQETVAAFDRYVKTAEARMSGEMSPGGAFLYPDGLSIESREATYDQLRHGAIVVTRLETAADGHHISIPKGMVHHWVGIAFIPNMDLATVVRVAQDYGHRTEVYKPDVIVSKLLWHEGNDYKIFLRLFYKKFATVILNTEYTIHWTELDSDRSSSTAYSTKIAEVQDPSHPDGPELPVGEGHGYLWRLYTYWRFAAKDGGVYVQCEIVALTRDIPFGMGWLIRPLVTSIPRQSLTRTLSQTRAEILRQSSKSANWHLRFCAGPGGISQKQLIKAVLVLCDLAG